MSNFNQNADWFPLRNDGRWLDEEHWERNLRVLRTREEGTRALRALGEVFTPSWSRDQTEIAGTLSTTEAPALAGIHPIVRDSIGVGGRHRLLEVGAMAAAIRDKKTLRKRLLPKGEYHGTCSEMRGGLLLSNARASVEWEPVKTRKPADQQDDPSGPDWLARWPNGSLLVEVKRPHESKRARARSQLGSDFFFEFIRAVSPLSVDTGIWLTLRANEKH